MRVLLLAVAVFLLAAPPASRDYWLYVGSHTTKAGSQGIYLYKFHAGSGALDAKGLAAGRLWQSNSDALASSVPRMFAQIRAQWPDFKMIVRGVQEPTFLAVHPNGRFLYTADSKTTGTVSAFQINPANGKLTILNTESSGGGLPVYLTLDRTARNLLVANYSGSIAVLPIDPGGLLRHATSIVTHNGHAHSIVLSPDNRFVLAADTGLDQIFVYKFDAGKGTVTPNEPPFLKLPPGTAPRHLVFHPNGALAYVVGEASSSVTALRWDGLHGTLTPIQTITSLPPGFHGQSGGADVLISPGGKFLYASNRGHDSIAVFAIDSAMGTLTPVQYAPSYGNRPSNLQIEPAGNYLFAANVGSDSLVKFHIDRKTGRLTPLETRHVPVPMGMGLISAP